MFSIIEFIGKEAVASLISVVLEIFEKILNILDLFYILKVFHSLLLSHWRRLGS